MCESDEDDFDRFHGPDPGPARGLVWFYLCAVMFIIGLTIALTWQGSDP